MTGPIPRKRHICLVMHPNKTLNFSAREKYCQISQVHDSLQFGVDPCSRVSHSKSPLLWSRADFFELFVSMPKSSCASSCSRFIEVVSAAPGSSSQARRRRKVLPVRVHFHEAVLGAELDAGRICLLTVLSHDPTVQKLRAYVERPVGIPDQVSSGIRAVVESGGCSAVGIVHCGVGIDRAGAQRLDPIVLIGGFYSNGRRGLQVRTCK